MTLIEFLLARIAEDEAMARAADWAMQGTWYTEAEDSVDEYVRGRAPRRVLAECAAKRAIVNHAHTPPRGTQSLNPPSVIVLSAAYGKVLMILATPYANHPDYLPEWKP